MNPETLIKITDLKKTYKLRQGFRQILERTEPEGARFVNAVDALSCEILRGESLGLVGESGCGKTTLGKMIVLLETPDSGSIKFEGQEIIGLRRNQLKQFRKKSQMIFQDPYQSLNPRFDVYDTINEPLVVHKIGSKEEKKELVSKILESVGLAPPEHFLKRYPHELSGGERQRVFVARALILQPSFIVADEPVSMLDVSIRAEVLSMIKELRKNFNLTMLFITHDLAIARYMSDRIAIMYYGDVREIGPTERVISNPLHPYTQLLLRCVPIPDPAFKRERVMLSRDFFSLPETGCKFSNRCPFRENACKEIDPKLIEVEPDHLVACEKYCRG